MITFEGAEVYLPHGIFQSNVTVADSQIVEIGGPARGEVIKASGLILAPAMIDLHGDAFERQLMPRPGVFFPMEAAVLETDRQLAANGIATAYHSITLGYEPGLRSLESGRSMMAAIRALAPRLTVENRVQLRWETFATEALDVLDWAMDAPLKPSLAFNDHLSMSLRGAETTLQGRLFEHNPEFEVMSFDDNVLLSGATANRFSVPVSNMSALKRLSKTFGPVAMPYPASSARWPIRHARGRFQC